MTKAERLFRQAVRSAIHNEGAPAVLGNNAGVIYFTDQDGIVHGDEVWARYVEGDETLAEVRVKNSYLPAVYDLPLRIVSRQGELTAIIDSNGRRMQKFTNNGGWLPLQQHGFTHRIGGTDPRYVEGRAFEPGLVRPSEPAAMTVYVMAAWYKYNGRENVWSGGNSGSLAAYVPSTDNNQEHFVIICLDRLANSLAIVDGNDYPAFYGSALSLSDIAAVSIPDDYYPLGVVELYYGQTTVTAADITYDRRRWLGDDSSGRGSLWIVDYDCLIVANTHAYIPGTADVTGTLTVEGALRIV